MKVMPALLIAILLLAACSGKNDNEHTTLTTMVSPPPRQELRAEFRTAPQIAPKLQDLPGTFDPEKPLLILNLPNSRTFRGEDVVIDFSLANARLKGDGGEYQVRYLVDDEDMKWLDRWEQVALSGWLPGKHTIRVELVGGDGWPYRNGDFNVETREITIEK